MTEKETQETVEEQNQEEVTEETEELSASEGETPEEAEPTSEQTAPEVEATVPEAPVAKKGLMQRRPDYSQSSVPNVHKGYSTNPPIVMLLIVSVFILLSIIFATSAVIN